MDPEYIPETINTDIGDHELGRLACLAADKPELFNPAARLFIKGLRLKRAAAWMWALSSYDRDESMAILRKVTERWEKQCQEEFPTAPGAIPEVPRFKRQRPWRPYTAAELKAARERFDAETETRMRSPTYQRIYPQRHAA